MIKGLNIITVKYKYMYLKLYSSSHLNYPDKKIMIKGDVAKKSALWQAPNYKKIKIPENVQDRVGI